METVKLLQKLIKTPSLSGKEEKIAKILREELNRIGVDRVELDSYGNVIAEIRGGGEESIMLEGHMDHVPPGKMENWKYHPYSAKIIDNEIFGRGSVDMKGSIAAMIKALEKAAEKEWNRNIILTLVVHEETVEGAAIRRIFEEKIKIKPEIIIIGEPTNLNLALGHRGRALIKVELTGRTAHASMPEQGLNMINAASKYIRKIMEIKLPKDLWLGEATITPISIECTPKGLPQIPDNCTIIFDRRLVLGEEEDETLKPLNEILEEFKEENIILNGNAVILEETVKCWTGRKIKVKDYFPAWMTHREDEAIIKLERILKDLKPQKIYWKFSTDGVYTSGTAGIKTVGFGPGDWRIAHQPNEHINLRMMLKASEKYYQIIEKFGEE